MAVFSVPPCVPTGTETICPMMTPSISKALLLALSMLMVALNLAAQPNDGTMPDTTSVGGGGSGGAGFVSEQGYLTFEAGSAQDGVALQWTTAWEYDVVHYLVERSADAQVFEVVGQVLPGGPSTELAEHSFLDATAMTGPHYYRLRIVRASLPTTVSLVLIVEHRSVLQDMSLYPCPADGELHVLLPRAHDRPHYRIMDTQGRCRRQGGLEAPSDRLSVEGLPAGAYTLLVFDQGGRVLHRTPWMKM